MLKRLTAVLLISGICVGILAGCNKESDVTEPVVTEAPAPTLEQTEKETKATQKATEKK